MPAAQVAKRVAKRAASPDKALPGTGAARAGVRAVQKPSQLQGPDARRIVLATTVVVVALVAYDVVGKNLEGKDAFRALWGAGLLFIMLSFLADVVPQIAGPFSLLVLVSALIARQSLLYKIVGVGTLGSALGNLSPVLQMPNPGTTPNQGLPQ